MLDPIDYITDTDVEQVSFELDGERRCLSLYLTLQNRFSSQILEKLKKVTFI